MNIWLSGGRSEEKESLGSLGSTCTHCCIWNGYLTTKFYCIAQGTLLNVMWEGSLGENGYVYVYGWVLLLSTWNYQNIVDWLYVLLSHADSVRPQRWQPSKLPCPWYSPGKNTGVGCHFLLQCVRVKSESEVVQSCPTLRDPMDCSPPGSSVHEIFQARLLEWGAIAFSNFLL